MKFENLEISGFKSAFRGARNPLDSWDKSDSYKIENDFFTDFHIGENDMGLAHRLIDAGSDSDCKFLRMIYVAVDITAPVYFWRELDTYKVGTTTNSRSLQHRGMVKDYEIEDFTFEKVPTMTNNDYLYREDLQTIINIINHYRQKYKETKDYTYFRIMRQLMPMGYNYTETWCANYAVLRNIYRQRKNHKLSEWHDFCKWIETLPYSELITRGTDVTTA
jgi:hypothetical protein